MELPFNDGKAVVVAPFALFVGCTLSANTVTYYGRHGSTLQVNRYVVVVVLLCDSNVITVNASKLCKLTTFDLLYHSVSWIDPRLSKSSWILLLRWLTPSVSPPWNPHLHHQINIWLAARQLNHERTVSDIGVNLTGTGYYIFTANITLRSAVIAHWEPNTVNTIYCISGARCVSYEGRLNTFGHFFLSLMYYSRVCTGPGNLENHGYS